jgi:hypothetical protein
MSMKPNVLLCCTGSVATLKVPEIAFELSKWANVLIVTTKASRHFLLSSAEYNPSSWEKFQSIGGMKLCLHDEHEWYSICILLSLLRDIRCLIGKAFLETNRRSCAPYRIETMG